MNYNYNQCQQCLNETLENCVQQKGCEDTIHYLQQTNSSEISHDLNQDQFREIVCEFLKGLSYSARFSYLITFVSDQLRLISYNVKRPSIDPLSLTEILDFAIMLICPSLPKKEEISIPQFLGFAAGGILTYYTIKPLLEQFFGTSDKKPKTRNNSIKRQITKNTKRKR